MFQHPNYVEKQLFRDLCNFLMFYTLFKKYNIKSYGILHSLLQKTDAVHLLEEAGVRLLHRLDDASQFILDAEQEVCRMHFQHSNDIFLAVERAFLVSAGPSDVRYIAEQATASYGVRMQNN